MKVYIATKWENKRGAQNAAQILEAKGYEVTHRWFEAGVEEGFNLRECAENDLEGVRAADVFVLLSYPHKRGAFVEMGYFLAAHPGAPVYVVTEPLYGNVYWCIFNELPNVFTISSLDKIPPDE